MSPFQGPIPGTYLLVKLLIGMFQIDNSDLQMIIFVSYILSPEF